MWWIRRPFCAARFDWRHGLEQIDNRLRRLEGALNTRLSAFLTLAMWLVGAAAYAQSAPPENHSRSERATDDWAGFYVGANFGHMSETFSEFAGFPPIVGPDGSVIHSGETLGPASGGSGTIGFQVGYDRRLFRGLFGGLEVQLTRASPLAFGLGNGVLDVDLRSFHGGLSTSARVRVGAPLTTGLLVYGTAGAALSRVTAIAATSLPGVIVDPTSARMKGLTVGFGAEYALLKRGRHARLAVGAEYRRLLPDSESFPFASLYFPGSTPGELTTHANELDVRVKFRFAIKSR